MNILGLIPARAGSKGIPSKNIAPLDGRPLLAYTCQAAAGSRMLSRVLLSTDSSEIAAVGRAEGIEVPFLRPPELSADDTPSIDVALHALEWLREHDDWMPDTLVLLQPTSPLRTASHIDEAIALLHSRGAIDTVVSVMEVPHRYSPFSIMRNENGRLVPYMADAVPFDRYRRQTLPTFFARNGPAVLATRSEVVLSRRSFYGDTVLPYVMSAAESVDIDEPFDLLVAAAALKYRPSR